MSFSAAGQHEILAALHRLSVEREKAEKQMRADFDTTAARIQRELSDSRQGAIMKFQFERDATQREFDMALVGAKSVYNTRHEIAEDDLRKTLLQLEGERNSTQRKAKKRLTEENWEANTVFEATQNAPQLQFEQEQQELIARHDVLRRAIDVAKQHLAACRLSRVQHVPIEPAAEVAGDSQTTDLSTTVFKDDPAAQLNDLAMAAIIHLESFRQLRLPKLWMGNRPAGFVFFIMARLLRRGIFDFWHARMDELDLADCRFGRSGNGGRGQAAFGYINQAVAAAIPPYQRFHQMLAEGDVLRRTATEQAKQRALEEGKRILSAATVISNWRKEKFDATMVESAARYETTTVTAHETRDRTEAGLIQTRDASLAEANNSFPKRLDDIQQRYQRDLAHRPNTF